MKNLNIDGRTIIIYEDGSVRIPYENINLCFDIMDIENLYRESQKTKAHGKLVFDDVDPPEH